MLHPKNLCYAIERTSETNACLLLDLFQQQLANTFAYYTYLLLVLKSAVHLAIIIFCLFRRTAIYGDRKRS
jgi:hypothetical protein